MPLRTRLKHFFTFVTTSNTFIAVLVMLVGIAATIVSWQEAQDTVDTKVRSTLVQSINDTDDAIQKRMAIYEELMRGTVGLFEVNNNAVSKDDFAEYARGLDIRNRFPGMQALCYAPVLVQAGIATHEQAIRSGGAEGYSVFPEGKRDVYIPIMYVEPYEDERNRRALGYDMYSDPTRRSAMDSARDSGQPATSDTLVLVKEDVGNEQPSFLYYFPIYQGATDSLEARRANLSGFICAPIRLGDLMASISDQDSQKSVALRIFSNTNKSPESLVFQNQVPQKGVTVDKNLNLRDHTWVVQASGNADVLSQQERQQPFLILLLGTGASLLLAAFIFIAMRSRGRELAYQKQLDIQQAKDELLSLASHQLRTPATGVKQYIGIVLEGYTGDITTEQRQMLQKANASNERQLEIVNQLLHVTRLETGRLMLRFANFNLTSLLEDIISEQHDTITSRRQKLKFKKPREQVEIYGDEQYLRMAIENLLSNASKYTYAGGDIALSVAEAPDRITVTISDTGVGIDPDDYIKLFQKFSRIDNELSVQAGGSGIGLYLTKEIIELHGGTISVDSEREAGSTFTIVLPKRH